MREREIAGLLRDKHPDGMQQLLLHYGPLIRYIIAPIVPDAHDREDCFSEVTLRIWEKADRFAPQRGSWKAWLTAVTRNTAYNFARQTARRGEGELPEHAPSPAPDPEEALLWAERRRRCSGARAAEHRGAGAVLPEILLLTADEPDCIGAWNDGARRRGAALPPEKAAARNAGR